MKFSINKYLELANLISTSAANYLVKNYGSTKVMTKKNENHYTIQQDRECNQIYVDFFKKNTPEASLYTEEGERSLKNDLVWVVDPIDGTSNYRVGNPFFNTQVCLLFKGELILSIINAPILNQKFYAVKNQGSFLNSKKIQITKTADLKLALLSVGRGPTVSHSVWFGNFLPNVSNKIRTMRVFGSCGLELAYVAAGKIDLHIDYGNKIYDYLPGILLIREAGGVVWNFQGNDWKQGDEGIIATNQILAEKILPVIKQSLV